MAVTDIEDLDKVLKSFTKDEFVKKLANCWNTQITHSSTGAYVQNNEYLKAIFNQKYPQLTIRERAEISKEFRSIVEDTILDTEILLKDSSTTVYSISEITVLESGAVFVTFPNDRKENVYTRNGHGRELMLVRKASELELTRPGIEVYYSENKSMYPTIEKLMPYFECIPAGYPTGKVAEAINRKFLFTVRLLNTLLKEYERMFKACGYQLSQRAYRGTN